jgi:hypothetical protein
MRSFSSWAERRQLVKFACEVVRMDGLSAAVKVRDGVTDEKKLGPLPRTSTTCRVIMSTTSDTLKITKRENCSPTPDDFIITVHDARFVISAYDLEKFRVR